MPMQITMPTHTRTHLQHAVCVRQTVVTQVELRGRGRGSKRKQ